MARPRTQRRKSGIIIAGQPLITPRSAPPCVEREILSKILRWPACAPLPARISTLITMQSIHQTTVTITGQDASYGYDRGTTWVACDHSNSRRTVIYATPTWSGGLARLRMMIQDHGIQIKPEHAELFTGAALAAA